MPELPPALPAGGTGEAESDDEPHPASKSTRAQPTRRRTEDVVDKRRDRITRPLPWQREEPLTNAAIAPRNTDLFVIDLALAHLRRVRAP
jgi:hypothetical protein